MFSDALVFLLAAVCAFVFGTFAEYFVHRAMHWGWLHPAGHRWHHESGESRNFLRDFLDYGTGAALLCWLGFLVSTMAGLGWLLGAFAYAAAASYSHQVQHANADLVFWMKRPVHRLHHVHDMHGRNFGILVDWWDRLFGTYEPIEWPKTPPEGGFRFRDYLGIHWFSGGWMR
jgi:sterol desaturase/sphingolipid hydroxylase (fatty acid hydroxylase superfamily)